MAEPLADRAAPRPTAEEPAVTSTEGRPPRLVILTGMSGAGRTTAGKVMEDLGWFVIDNLPSTLIERVVDLAQAGSSGLERIALVVDVRGHQLFGDFREPLEALARRGVEPTVVFLEASDDALVRRYSEARRAHPMSDGERVVEGIERERALLEDLRAEAHLVIDTTDLNVHELRARIERAFGEDREPARVALVSFGYKHGTPMDADFVIDARFLPNPHWDPELRPRTGTDARVREAVIGDERADRLLDHVDGLLALAVPGLAAQGKPHLTVAVGCTGGRHRSVAVVEELAARLRARDVPVAVEHRDEVREEE